VLKFLFWGLVAVNGVLFAYGQGYLGKFKGNEHEPARLKSQVNTDKQTLISAAQAQANADKAAPAQAADTAAAPPATADLVACTEIGNFSEAQTRRFEGQLGEFGFGERQTRVAVPTTDVTQHVVYIPSQGSKEAAEKKAAELKNLGITNFYIMPDAGPMKWAISLGVFKTDAAAQTLLAGLNKQGVHSARVSGRGPTVNRYAYQFRQIGSDVRAQLDKLRTAYSGIDIRTCK
jgi:hypothetical protein